MLANVLLARSHACASEVRRPFSMPMRWIIGRDQVRERVVIVLKRGRRMVEVRDWITSMWEVVNLLVL
jgi:hypothetical protein